MPSAHLDTISLVDPAFWRRTDRDQIFEQFRRLAPIWWHPDSDTIKGFWSLTRHAEVDLVSRDWKTFCSRLGTAITDEPVELSRALGGMLNMDAPEHVRLRKIVNHAFKPKSMQAIASGIEDCARQTISAIAKQGECDFATDIAQTVSCERDLPDARRSIERLARATPFKHGGPGGRWSGHRYR